MSLDIQAHLSPFTIGLHNQDDRLVTSVGAPRAR